MNIALSEAQSFGVVLACALVVLLAIAMPLRWASAATAAIGAAGAIWLRNLGDVVGSTALLLLALLSGTIIRQRQERAREREQLLLENVAAADARREADVLQERAVVAREMHDVLAHTLAGLMIQLERTRVLAADHGAADVVHQLVRAHAMASSGLTEARDAISALRGEQSLDERAIHDLTTGFAEATGLPIELAVSGAPADLPPQQQLLLYRTVQEALTNAAKHASPTAISVKVDYRDSEVTASIENDGGAAAPADESLPVTGATAFGLRGMRERVALAGGHLEAHHTEAGYIVAVSVPR